MGEEASGAPQGKKPRTKRGRVRLAQEDDADAGAGTGEGHGGPETVPESGPESP